jgi:putative transcriptional regulator|tara:strand:+ start:1161 stop:1745 length:585 start_codon:yes stop_codon:yes gene_type:complete
MDISFANISKLNNLKPKKGRLLLAEPFMDDDDFARSVIYMCEHNKTGSYGFILNNNLKIKLDEIIPDIEIPNISVHYGGPVNSSNLFFLHQLGDIIENSVKISDKIWTSGDFNQIIEFINMGILDINKLKFFLGYSGWSNNQLATEFDSNSWIATDVIQENIFSKNEDLWKEVLLNRGGKLKAIANFPINPKDN